MRKVLAIGAHPDDIELGCGGTLAKHVLHGDQVSMLVVTRGEVGPGETSQRIAEQEKAAAVLGVQNLYWGEIPDCAVSLHELALVHLIESVIRDTDCDLIYTHNLSDSHQDHRAVALGTTGAARKVSSILTYDAPSSLTFQPTVFCEISGTIDQKVDALLCHASQVAASEMVDPNRVRSQAVARGHQARILHNAATPTLDRYAEAFESIRYAMYF